MWTPESEKELLELETLIETEIKRDGNPDYQQYITLNIAGSLNENN